MQVRNITRALLCMMMLTMPFSSSAQRPSRDKEKEKQWKSMENGPWNFAPDWYYYFLHNKLSLAPFLRKTGCFVGNQIGSTEGCLDFIGRPYEWQGLCGMIDIGIDGTAVNTEVSCCLTHRVGLFRDYFHEIFVYHHSCFSVKVG